MQSKNLVLSNTSLNLLNNTFIENLVYNDKIYDIEEFYHKNITVYRKKLNLILYNLMIHVIWHYFQMNVIMHLPLVIKLNQIYLFLMMEQQK